MTEILLTGMLSINTNKQTFLLYTFDFSPFRNKCYTVQTIRTFTEVVSEFKVLVGCC